MLTLAALAVILLAGCAILWCGRRGSAERAAMLRPCASLLAEPAEGRDLSGFGTLDGLFEGVPVSIRLIPEAVAFRRLPQLWLSVSVHVPTGQPATLDVLRRVAGAEFYAPAAELPRRFPVPEGWPGDAYLRGSRDAAALVDRTGALFARLLADPRVKESLVTPRGLRIVSQLCEGERGAYLLLRESRFPVRQVEPETLRPHLVRATGLARHLIHEGVADEPGSRAA
ncbi:hypothetical protein U8607_17430 [Methylobacterium durans]|uniref:hypothetical protein n=1 Tax=Methylobacterium durans TaxID=2202825 RepID=UPI002AFDE592|nr:hypothetical protein [Methylobacterium durans]MEA1833871.1 hypothetical protein [Methylobacterium durans]